jgi:hypothetical protein
MENKRCLLLKELILKEENLLIDTRIYQLWKTTTKNNKNLKKLEKNYQDHPFIN